MEEKKVKINIKYSFDKNYSVEISLSATVLQLKEECSKLVNIPPSSLNLIYRGKILPDADLLSKYNLENDQAMHLVAIKGGDSKPGSSSTQPAAQNVPSNLSSGGSGALNSFGISGLGPNTDYRAVSDIMNNPMFNQMITQMLSNPQMMEMMINSNPMLRNMTEQNPEMLSALRDPAALQMLRDPQVISGAMGMLGRMNPNQLGSMGAQSNLPMPGSAGLNTNGTQQAGSTNASASTANPAGAATNQPIGGGAFGQGAFNPWAFGFPPAFGMNQQQGQAANTGTQQAGVGAPFQGARNPFMPPFGFGQMFGAANNGASNQAAQNTNSQAANPGATGTAPVNPFTGMPFSPFMNAFQPAQVNYEERYKEQLKAMEEMGFVNKEVNLKALIATNGNVELAIERMLNLLG